MATLQSFRFVSDTYSLFAIFIIVAIICRCLVLLRRHRGLRGKIPLSGFFVGGGTEVQIIQHLESSL